MASVAGAPAALARMAMKVIQFVMPEDAGREVPDPPQRVGDAYPEYIGRTGIFRRLRALLGCSLEYPLRDKDDNGKEAA